MVDPAFAIRAMNAVYTSTIQNNPASTQLPDSERVAERRQAAVRLPRAAIAGSLATVVTISEEAFRRADQLQAPAVPDAAQTALASSATYSPRQVFGAKKKEQVESAGETDKSQNEDQAFSDEELQQIDDLKKRDREVRAHEMAHVVAGGSLVRKGASFSFKTGPDGVRYAVGGEVSIDTSEVKDDPQATIRKMQHVQRAALAPAQPSGQDRAVASSASQKASTAQAELYEQDRESSSEQDTE